MEIKYTAKPKKRNDIYSLYEELNWNDFLKLNEEQLEKAMEQSFYVIYVYDEGKLVATGRAISDGITNAYICGLGIMREYRNKGIGTEIIKRLKEYCKSNKLYIQLFCEERLVHYYENMGFEVFAVGLKAK